jgi:hypothetical protein
VAYRLYHWPVGIVRASLRAGGPLNQWRTNRGRIEMERDAWSMNTGKPPAVESTGTVHLLTGAKYWYQSAFCLASLQAHANVSIAPLVYDDGTLTDGQRRSLSRVNPRTSFQSRPEIELRLDEFLPHARFPTLRAHRLRYPHLRKLTDVHAGSSGWKLVLDSDMLFFRRPDFILDWLANPIRPCHMLDVMRSYGYSETLMTELCGRTIPELVNVGLCGLRSDSIDWDRLEFWCKELLAREGSSYYLEQALTAMLIAGQSSVSAPKIDYVVLPSPTECRNPSAVLHHYVAASKAGYFQFAWRQARAAIRSAGPSTISNDGPPAPSLSSRP